MPTERLNRALLLALVIHASVFGLLGRSGRSLRQSPERCSPAHLATPTEIELEPLVAATPETTTPSAKAETGPGPAPGPVAVRERSSAPRAAFREDAEPPLASGEAPHSTALESEPAADGAWTFSPLRAAAPDIGIGRSGYRVGKLSGAPGDGSHGDLPAGGRPSNDGAIASVRAGLDARDREVGLGAGGPLIDATRDAVSSSLVPNFARALLEFTTDQTGLVIGVRVLDTNGDRRAWEDVSEALLQTTRKKPLRVPPGAAGVAVTMQVESKVALPSGHDAGETALSLFGIPLKSSNAEHPIRVDVTSVVGGNIDLTEALMDATAKPRRVVAAWVTAERRL